MTPEDQKLVEKYLGVTEPRRTHVPELERWARNQMPKDNSWSELKLYRFDGTDLYQWRGKSRMQGVSGLHYYVWEDPATEVFQIAEK